MEGTFLCLREARRRLKALSLIAPASDLENFARGKKRKRGKKKNPSGMKTRFGQQLRVEISFIYIYIYGGWYTFRDSWGRKKYDILDVCRGGSFQCTDEKYTHHHLAALLFFHERIKRNASGWKLSLQKLQRGSRFEVNIGPYLGIIEHRSRIRISRPPPPLSSRSTRDELVKVSFSTLENKLDADVEQLVNFACSR